MSKPHQRGARLGAATLTALAPDAAVSAREVADGRLAASTLAVLRRNFTENGVVVLDGVLPTEALDTLRDIMDANTVRGAVDPDWDGLIVPRHEPWVLPDIVCNPLVEQVAAELLGTTGVAGGALLTIYQSNTNLPGTASIQEMHLDDHWDWPDAASAARADQPHPHETMSLVANFGTSDITLDRGATVIWPRSHRVVGVAAHSRADLRHDSMDLEEFFGEAVWSAYEAGETYPARMALSKGAVAFRDTRCWHHAVPKCVRQPALRRSPPGSMCSTAPSSLLGRAAANASCVSACDCPRV